MTVAQIMAASNVPFNSQSNKAIPSFHPPTSTSLASAAKDNKKSSNDDSEKTFSMTNAHKRVLNEEKAEKKMYY